MAANLQMPNREALLLPDRITPYDNLELPPPPDASWLLSQVDDMTATPVGRKGRTNNNRDINLQEDLDFSSQFLQGSNEQDADDILPMGDEDLELELDFGFSVDESIGQSVEMGRDAPAPLPVEDDALSDLDVMPRKDPATEFSDVAVRIAEGDNDIPMVDDDGFAFNPDDASTMPGMTSAAGMNRARISESPLSDIDERLAQEVEAEYASHKQTDLYEPQEDTELTVVRRPAQRSKKQKIMMPDDEISLSSSLIRQQQADRQSILKAASFLPHDPFLLGLMDMHKTGGFVSSILTEGRSSAWAAELQGMLSLGAVRGLSDLKRKRDSGIADVDSDHGATKSPRLELGDDTDFALDDHGLQDPSMAADGTILEIPAADDEDHFEREGSPMNVFDETTAPVVHPEDSGPVSVGTKHAVHVLRELFGAEAATNAEKRKKSSVVFQHLLPEKVTTKAEATKMFFECLVLATKDAIKVEQGPELGASIRVRGKRGLWGDWAEREAGGEISNQNEPEPAAVNATQVAVEA